MWKHENDADRAGMVCDVRAVGTRTTDAFRGHTHNGRQRGLELHDICDLPSKLSKKGFVGFDLKGRDKFYYPLVEMDECIQAESKSLMEKLSGAGAKQLLVCMIREGNLSKKTKKELRALIDELSEGSE